MGVSNIIPPDEFVAALQSLRDAPLSSDLTVEEVPSPPHLAPFSAALSIQTKEEAGGRPLANSTLVILYDPTQVHVWGGPYRLVGHLRSQIDGDMGEDPLLSEIMWVSLVEALTEFVGETTNPVGTVTKELSQTFGGLKLRTSALNVEVRCSWTSHSHDLTAHVAAWSQYLLESAGLPWEHPLGLEIHSV